MAITTVTFPAIQARHIKTAIVTSLLYDLQWSSSKRIFDTKTAISTRIRFKVRFYSE